MSFHKFLPIKKRFYLLLAFLLWGGMMIMTTNAVDLKKGDRLYKDGNYLEAYQWYQDLLLKPETRKGEGLSQKQAVEIFEKAIQCLAQLNWQEGHAEDFIDEVLAFYPDDWRIKLKAAQLMMSLPHMGSLIDEKYMRNQYTGLQVGSEARDYVKAMKLARQANQISILDESASRLELAEGVMMEAELMLNGKSAWELQSLTDLETIPELVEMEEPRGYRRAPWNRYSGSQGNTGYPVGEDGKAVYFALPETYETAKNDGERWRWLLHESGKLSESFHLQAKLVLARQLYQWFDVHTTVGTPIWNLAEEEAGGQEEGSTKSPSEILRNLKDDETLVRLATGIEKIKLPEDWVYLRLLSEVGESQSVHAVEALILKAQIHEQRHQRKRAAEVWKKVLERGSDHQETLAQQRIRQIEGNLGKLMAHEPQPAGTPSSVTMKYRNAKEVTFKIKQLQMDRVLDQVRKDLRALAKNAQRDANASWDPLRSVLNGIIPHELIWDEEKMKSFLSPVIQEWSEPLMPKPEHEDAQTTLTLPISDRGIYLVEAHFEGGATTACLVEITDMIAFYKTNVADQNYLGFAVDARNGRPIPKAVVERIGLKQIVQRSGNDGRIRFELTEEKHVTGDTGEFVLKGNDQSRWNERWLTIIQAPDGRRTLLGFRSLYRPDRSEMEVWEQNKVFLFSDRPLYRPGQDVHLSAWVRKTTYAEGESGNDLAGKPFTARIHNPMGEEVFTTQGVLDDKGRAFFDFSSQKTATLGSYQVNMTVGGIASGYLQIRFEEYKKPEFEVLVHTPTESIKLGDTFKATIEARYFFGLPVSEGKVKYKITRVPHDATWFPVSRWDWLYGSGYWWRSYDYHWLPAWRTGPKCYFPWFPRPVHPPEIIQEIEVPIGKDGKVEVTINTANAKEFFGNQDQRYEIHAEVVDASRRMITGSGSVLAPAKPYQVYLWMDRGYYETGKEATVSLQTHAPSGGNVEGKAELRVSSITYQDNGDSVEEELQRFDLELKGKEPVTQKLQFPKAGQYLIRARFTDKNGHQEEATQVTLVRGKEFDGENLKFSGLELTLEKNEYFPGEEASLQINVDQEGGTVFIYERVAGGDYRKPKVVTLPQGKSLTHRIKIDSKDQPNFFVEVVTIHQAKLMREVIQVPVPPQKRVAEVNLKTPNSIVKPGGKGEVEIRVTHPDGTPVKGSVLLTGYDKALDALAPGGHVSSILDAFWGWKRSYFGSEIHSLQTISPFYGRHDEGMQPIGFQFGDVVNSSQNLRVRKGAMGGAPMPSTRAMSFSNAPEEIDMLAMSSAPAPLAEADSAPKGEREELKKQIEDATAPPPEVEATMRQDFADLLIWKAVLETDDQGKLRVPLDFPDDLTTWNVKAWFLGPNSEVGEAKVEITSRKELMVRLQAPRFFVEKDEVVLSGVVNHRFTDALSVRALLELDGEHLELVDATTQEQTQSIAAEGEHRFDWRVRVLKEGESVVRIKALSAKESDAMEKTYPVLVYGMNRQEAWSLAIRKDEAEGKILFEVSEARRPALTKLEVQYSPSLAAAMVNALPFLVSYPHGCTEQTLNRFVPTVITRDALKKMNLDLEQIRDVRSKLNPQELGDAKNRAAQWQRWKDQEPVFDDQAMDDMIQTGIKRLESMRADDGGWGWWPGASKGSAHITAQVVDGLIRAEKAGMKVPAHLIQEGVEWLVRHEAESLRCLRLPKKHRDHRSHVHDLDALVFSVLAQVGRSDSKMGDDLYDQRLNLSKSMQSFLGIAFHTLKENKRRDMIVRNLEQFQKVDPENQTAWLDLGNQVSWWYWMHDDIETMANYLMLRVLQNPQDDIAPQLVKYLLNNRKHGTYWKSTRDTGAAIHALATYLEVTGETEVDMIVEVVLDGKVIKEMPVNSENLFTADHSVVLEGEVLTTGKHELILRRKGHGQLYANAYLNVFTLEDPIKEAGLEVKVQRRLWKIIPEEKETNVAGSKGQVVTVKGSRDQRVEIDENTVLKSGEIVEVELILDSKNDYEYLMLEDPKASGMEALESQSGYVSMGMVHAYREFRDQKVCYYIENLGHGTHSLRYRLRAEIPGKFSALPAVIIGMYAPELKGNSESQKVEIKD